MKKMTIILTSMIMIMSTLFITQISAYAFTPGTKCEGAPFVWPTWGKQGALWRYPVSYLSADGDYLHDGIDIWQVNGQENVEPVYAVCNGSLQPYTTTAFLIQCDPIDSSFQVPHNQVWIYYTHMGNYSGSVSYVLPEFHPGNPASRVTQGQLLGYQGIKGTTFVHLHFSVNTCASESCNIDPSPYFGDNLDNTQVNPTWATPPFNCNTVVISEGCTDPNAVNYDPDATVDNRSCQYPRKPALTVLGYRLYQAVIRQDGNVATRYSFDGVHWAEWDEYGVAQGSVSMTSYDSKVFQAVIKTDGRIFTRTVDQNSWDQNGEARGTVEMATFNGRLYQSVIQADEDVYIRWREGETWYAWQKNGMAQGNVALTEFNGKLYQSVVQADGEIYHRYTQDGIKFSDWILTGNVPESGGISISTITHNGQLYQAVLVALSGKIYTRSSTDAITWGTWEQLGVAQGRVAMISHQGSLYQAVIQSDGEVYTRVIGSPAGWQQGGTAEGNVALIVFNNKLYQSVVQDDEDVYLRYCDIATCDVDNEWSTWYKGEILNENFYLLWTH